jgi:hypothetical protein
MKRISLLVIIPLSLLMASCAPTPDGQGYNTPYGEEQMGPGYPYLMDGEGNSSPSFHGHDHDRGGHRDYNRDHEQNHDGDRDRAHDRDHDGDHNRDGLRDFGRDRK